jgi:choline kinase
MTIQHAVILLAGYGSRLMPITDRTHKALLPVGGKTILQRQILQLIANGVTNLHLALGYRAEDIKNFVAQEFPGLNVKYYDNEMYETSNNGYSLYLVLKTLRETFLLIDGDLVMANAIMRDICSVRNQTVFVCETDKSKLDAEAMKIGLNVNAEVETISKKLSLAEAQGEAIGLGLYQKDWADALHTCLESCLKDKSNWNWYYEDAVLKLLNTGKAPSPIRILPTSNHSWVEVDDHDDLARAKNLNWD